MTTIQAAISPFEMLVNDLHAMQQRRESASRRQAQQAQTDRRQAEAQRNRRLAQAKPRRRVLAKAAPPAPVPVARPNFDRLAADQAQLEKAMQQTQQAAVQQRCRAAIADLRAQARAGRLTADEGARLDILIGRAGQLGLQP